MEKLDETIDLVFNELTQTLVDKHKFNSKLVNERVSRLKKFTKKADQVYFKYFKECVDHFLTEEEKIFEEISATLDEDESLTNEIMRVSNEIEESIEDTKEIVKQSRELSKGIETIGGRIQSYDKMRNILKQLDSVLKDSHTISTKLEEDQIVIDEM